MRPFLFVIDWSKFSENGMSVHARVVKSMSECLNVQIPSKPSVLMVKTLLLCLIVYPLMGLVYASTIRIIAVYFFEGAVIVIPWLVGFLGFGLVYITHQFFKNNSDFRQSPYINYLLVLALVIVSCVQWLVWTVYVLESHVSSDVGITLMQTYSYLDQIYTLATDPALFVDILKEINAVGTWRIDDDEDLMSGRTKGIMLMIFWVVEFLLLVLLLTFFVEIQEVIKE